MPTRLSPAPLGAPATLSVRTNSPSANSGAQGHGEGGGETSVLKTQTRIVGGPLPLPSVPLPRSGIFTSSTLSSWVQTQALPFSDGDPCCGLRGASTFLFCKIRMTLFPR